MKKKTDFVHWPKLKYPALEQVSRTCLKMYVITIFNHSLKFKQGGQKVLKFEY